MRRAKLRHSSILVAIQTEVMDRCIYSTTCIQPHPVNFCLSGKKITAEIICKIRIEEIAEQIRKGLKRPLQAMKAMHQNGSFE